MVERKKENNGGKLAAGLIFAGVAAGALAYKAYKAINGSKEPEQEETEERK